MGIRSNWVTGGAAEGLGERWVMWERTDRGLFAKVLGYELGRMYSRRQIMRALGSEREDFRGVRRAVEARPLVRTLPTFPSPPFLPVLLQMLLRQRCSCLDQRLQGVHIYKWFAFSYLERRKVKGKKVKKRKGMEGRDSDIAGEHCLCIAWDFISSLFKFSYCTDIDSFPKPQRNHFLLNDIGYWWFCVLGQNRIH